MSSTYFRIKVVYYVDGSVYGFRIKYKLHPFQLFWSYFKEYHPHGNALSPKTFASLKTANEWASSIKSRADLEHLINEHSKLVIREYRGGSN